MNNYGNVCEDPIDSDRLTPFDKLVYVRLCIFARGKDHCFPSVRTIAKALKIAKSTVQKSVINLEKEGVISCESAPGIPTKYRLNIIPSVPTDGTVNGYESVPFQKQSVPSDSTSVPSHDKSVPSDGTKEYKEEQLKKKKKNNNGDEDEEFKKFWDHYHEVTGLPKTDKEAAEKHWQKLKEEEKEKATQNVKPWYESVNPLYCKKARTYLSDKNFNDEFKKFNPNGTHQKHQTQRSRLTPNGTKPGDFSHIVSPEQMFGADW